MTIEEKINKLQAELDQLKAEANKEVSYNWEPRMNEDYWAVYDSGCIEEFTNDKHPSDMHRIQIGNCFKTEEEAEQYKKYLITLNELRKFAREKNKGEKLFNDPNFDITYWYFDWDQQENKINVGGSDYYNSGLPMFTNKKDAEEAITHFGDRLKILFTYNL